LEIINQIQNRIPLFFYLFTRQKRVPPRKLVAAQESDLRSLATRLSFDQSTYASLVSQYLTTLLSAPSHRSSGQDLKREPRRKAEPNPLREFVFRHNKKILRRLGRVTSGSGKGRLALSAMLEGSFLEVDSRYEAQVFLRNEVSKEEVQSVITAWKKDQQSFAEAISSSPWRTPPKIFWLSSSQHFVEEGIARYIFKTTFGVGAFESAFLEFESTLADAFSEPISGDGVRSRAVDLCTVSRSRQLMNRIRPSIEIALNSLLAEQTPPYWWEWVAKSGGPPERVPSVATTSFAALSLLKLSISESIRNRGKQAAAWLLEKQNVDGSWSLDFSSATGLVSEPDVHVTLTAMEAISRSEVAGAKRHLDLAHDWVLKQQGKNGLWEDKDLPLPQLAVLAIETLEFVDRAIPSLKNNYLSASVGYLRRALAILCEDDPTALRLALVTAHLGIESFLYAVFQFKNICKFIDNKGQTIGMRSALSSLQGWLQQNKYLKPNGLISFSNELGRLAYLRDEITHKALYVGIDDAQQAVNSAAQFVSTYSQMLLGFDCLD